MEITESTKIREKGRSFVQAITLADFAKMVAEEIAEDYDNESELTILSDLEISVDLYVHSNQAYGDFDGTIYPCSLVDKATGKTVYTFEATV